MIAQLTAKLGVRVSTKPMTLISSLSYLASCYNIDNNSKQNSKIGWFLNVDSIHKWALNFVLFHDNKIHDISVLAFLSCKITFSISI